MPPHGRSFTAVYSRPGTGVTRGDRRISRSLPVTGGLVPCEYRI